jgi:sulfate adenylyltransferase subunit 2
MDRLSELENRSIFIIREAHYRFRRLAILWSMGKDSTTLLWLCRKAFFGRVPFPVMHIDTSLKFPEMYAFRDELVREWGLQLIVARNEQALAAGMGPDKGSKLNCCMALKTEALRQCIAEHGFEALLLAIRRDEHGIRAKERHFSPRDTSFRWNYTDQPAELWDHYVSPLERESPGRQQQAMGWRAPPVPCLFVGSMVHYRVHPMLGWRELDVWLYIKREGIPVVPLYFARNGWRFRSLGCRTCCVPVASSAATIDEIIEELRTTTVAERSGRAQDKEDAYVMQKLRSLGYM